MPLNNEQCRTRHTLIDLNHVALNYSFMISLDKCNGSCNSVDNSSAQKCILNKISINAKTLIKQNVTAATNVQHIIQIKNGIAKHVNIIVKITISAKNIIVGIQGNVFVKKTGISKAFLMSQQLCVMKLYTLQIVQQI